MNKYNLTILTLALFSGLLLFSTTASVYAQNQTGNMSTNATGTYNLTATGDPEEDLSEAGQISKTSNRRR